MDAVVVNLSCSQELDKYCNQLDRVGLEKKLFKGTTTIYALLCAKSCRVSRKLTNYGVELLFKVVRSISYMLVSE